jgi:hypothetical protein
MAGYWEGVQRSLGETGLRLCAYDSLAFPSPSEAQKAIHAGIEESGSFLYSDRITGEPLFVVVPLEGRT